MLRRSLVLGEAKFEDAPLHRPVGARTRRVRRQGEFGVEKERSVLAHVLERRGKGLLAPGLDEEAPLLDPNVDRLRRRAGQVDNQQIRVVALEQIGEHRLGEVPKCIPQCGHGLE